MTSKLMMMLLVSVDIWAALLITQIDRQTRPLEVSIATSDENGPAPITTAEPIQIWLKKNGQTGFYPNLNRPIPLNQICRHLETTAKQDPTKTIEVRLLCDEELTIADWAKPAAALAQHAEEIRIAPLK